MRSSRFVRWLAPLLTSAGAIACGKASHTSLPPIERDSLSFRVLVDGQPLVGTEVRVSTQEWSQGSRFPSGSYGSPQFTDERGWLVLTLYSLEWSDPQELEVTVVHGERFGKHHGPRVRGRTTAADLVLELMPILTSGRVVDLEGAAVSGAEVLVVDPERPLPLRTATDERGEFALRVPGESGPDQRIFARHGERLSPLKPVEVSSGDVQLVLSSTTGGLVGRVLLDPEVPAESVTVQLYADELSSLAYRWGLFELSSTPDSGGAFSLVGRVPGRHRAQILIDSHELLTLRDVQVQPGPPGSDPRLDPLDLRGKIHVRRVRLASPDGQDVTAGTYLAHRSGSRDGSYMPIDGSELLILSPYTNPSVEIRAEGFRLVRLEELREDRTVHLQPGWPVRLVLDDDVRLPKPPVTWSVELKGAGPEHFAIYSPLTFERGRKDVRLVAMDVGEYEVLWHRGTPDDPPFHCWAGGQRGWPRQTVHVRDVPEEQILRLGWVPVAP